jgi:hypothetical protein
VLPVIAPLRVETETALWNELNSLSPLSLRKCTTSCIHSRLPPVTMATDSTRLGDISVEPRAFASMGAMSDSLENIGVVSV